MRQHNKHLATMEQMRPHGACTVSLQAAASSGPRRREKEPLLPGRRPEPADDDQAKQAPVKDQSNEQDAEQDERHSGNRDDNVLRFTHRPCPSQLEAAGIPVSSAGRARTAKKRRALIDALPYEPNPSCLCPKCMTAQISVASSVDAVSSASSSVSTVLGMEVDVTSGRSTSETAACAVGVPPEDASTGTNKPAPDTDNDGSHHGTMNHSHGATASKAKRINLRKQKGVALGVYIQPSPGTIREDHEADDDDGGTGQVHREQHESVQEALHLDDDTKDAILRRLDNLGDNNASSSSSSLPHRNGYSSTVCASSLSSSSAPTAKASSGQQQQQQQQLVTKYLDNVPILVRPTDKYVIQRLNPAPHSTAPIMVSVSKHGDSRAAAVVVTKTSAAATASASASAVAKASGAGKK